MKEKLLKFVPNLAKMIINGEKTTTFRLFDDKDLKNGDKLVLATKENGAIIPFARAEVTTIWFKTIETLDRNDFIGHEALHDPLHYYRNFYGAKVQPDSEVKVIRFKLIELI